MRIWDTATYRKARAYFRVCIDAGGVNCWRCGQPIAPGSAFDTGHDDHDKSIIRGPEHRRCNRATAGRRRRRLSRQW